MSELVCFIHSCTLPMWGSDKLVSLVELIRETGLLNKLSHLFINNVGDPLDPHMFQEENIMITNYSEDTGQFENSTLRQMYFYAQLHPDTKLLYLHTKGVSHQKGSAVSDNVEDWTAFMTYGLITHHEFCIEMLDRVDTVGMNYRSIKSCNPGYINPDHFSGNFWWVTAKYWVTVPIASLKSKADAEWILFKSNPTFINIFKANVYHYENPYKLHQYKDQVLARIQGFRDLFENIDTEEVYYGVPGCYVDVTASCKKGKTITVTAGDHERNQLFGLDPCFGTIKHVKIGSMTFGYHEDVRLRW